MSIILDIYLHFLKTIFADSKSILNFIKNFSENHFREPFKQFREDLLIIMGFIFYFTNSFTIFLQIAFKSIPVINLILI